MDIPWFSYHSPVAGVQLDPISSLSSRSIWGHVTPSMFSRALWSKGSLWTCVECVFLKLNSFYEVKVLWGFTYSSPACRFGEHFRGETIPNYFFCPPCLGHKPDGSGELGHCHPLGLRVPFLQEARQGGHSSAAEEPDQEPRSEDRYG